MNKMPLINLKKGNHHLAIQRKKKILSNLLEHYAKISQPPNKKTLPVKSSEKKQNKLLDAQPYNNQQEETVNQTQLKKIVKNALLKDIGNIDFEIQKLTKEQTTTNRNKPAYLDKYHSIYKNVTNNQTDLSKSEAKTQNKTYYTNRVQQVKFNSLVENSYSKLAESIRNHSNQKKQDEVKETVEKPRAYNFLQINSEQVKGKTKSVGIEIQNLKQINKNQSISERKIQKPPMKQLPSNRKSESEKTTPIKSILKQSNTYISDITKANTTQQVPPYFNKFYQKPNVNLQEAVNIYKSLHQLMNRSESVEKRFSANLLQTKKCNYMVLQTIFQSQKGIRQH